MIDLKKNLDKFNQVIAASYSNVYSVMIYQNDKQIFENYYRKAQPTDRRGIMSCTKSMLSAMAGIAIEKGYINNVNQHILDFFPDYLHAGSDPNILRIRIKHLLTMTSGFYYLRLASDSQPVAKRAAQYDDKIKYILDLPVNHPDLKTFNYNNFDADLISAIIEKSSGMEIIEFANKYLYSQLGFELPGSFEFTTYEMALFGLLYLNNGWYNGQQIITKDWIEQSKTNYGNGYGYMWWILKDNMYTASGAGGAMIMIIPNHNAVIVSQTKHLKVGWKSPRDAVMEILLNEV